MNPAGDGVRSTALEAALSDLERALCRDRCHVVVRASTGPAQALLLGALAERLGSTLRVIPFPDPGGEADPCAAILREIGEPAGDDAELSLIGVARRLASQGSALALVVGDARALPAPALRRLGRLAARARPGLRLILVHALEPGSLRDASAEIMATLGVGAVKVVLDPLAPQARQAAAAPAPAALATPAARPSSFGAIRVTPEARRGARSAPRAAFALALVLGLGLAAWEREGGTSLRALAASRPATAAPPRHPAAAPPRREAPTPEAPGAPEPEPARAESAKPAEDAPSPAPAHSAEPAPPAAPEPARSAEPTSPAVPEPARSAEPVPPAAPAPEPPAPAPSVERAAPEPAAPAPILEVDAAKVSPPTEPSLAEREVVAAIAEGAQVRVPTIHVSLNAHPWAHIEVDGKAVGVTPMADLELPVGPHRFRARFPDGRVMERTLRVDAVRDHIHFP